MAETEHVGNYKLIERIGEGGMAFIYKALQPTLKRTVVIKKLKDPNREIIQRFKQEALLSASFHHENLVSVYDFLYLNRSYYLIMEYVEGEDLRTLIDHLAPFPFQVAALIALSIARGLEYTHARNIIHRDIKPSNILISHEGEVKIIDFGIARGESSTRLTMTGMIVGTPAYMSPEQANGDELTPQSDIFSLGILLYEMCTGIKPFEGNNQTEVISRIIRGHFQAPGKINPTLPRRLRKIIRKCLAFNPKRRYRSAPELINDLERVLPWQIRNERKQIVARFLQSLDKNEQTPSSFVFRPLLRGMNQQRWQVLKWSFLTLVVLSSLLFFTRLQAHFLGEVTILADDTTYQLSADGEEPKQVLGPKIRLKNLTTGEHRIDLYRPGSHLKHSLYCRIKPQQVQELHLPEIETTGLSKIYVSSHPTSARIQLDNREMESTPLIVDSLAPGEHLLHLWTQSGREVHKKIVIAPMEYRILSFDLSED